jgi:hypothetical protein
MTPNYIHPAIDFSGNEKEKSVAHKRSNAPL